MKIRILYFGRPGEKLGLSEENVEVPADVTSVGTLLGWLRKRGPDWAQELTEARVRCAVNQEFTDGGAAIKTGDEIALFSPISGG